MSDRIILHCDINNFFASCECVANPALASFPVAVSGNPKTRTGIILAKNYWAKSYGVKTGEAIWEAKQKCPSLICVEPHMKLYEKISNQIYKIYTNYTELVEPFSIDECWLDITASAKLFGGAQKVAEKIKERIKSEVGVTASIGIAFNKLLAKLGSDLKKPDAITIITRQNINQKIYTLPAGDVIGVGKKTEKALAQMNIFTLGDIIKTEDKILKAKFGINGINLKMRLLGIDDEPVESSLNSSIPKSVGNGITTIADLKSRDEIKNVVYFLADKISNRMASDSLKGGVVSVSIKNSDFQTYSREKSLPYKTNYYDDIAKCSMEILDEFFDYKEQIRLVRISVGKIVKDDCCEQVSLFNEKAQQKTKFTKTINQIRKKYGDNSIALLSSNFDKIKRDTFVSHFD